MRPETDPSTTWSRNPWWPMWTAAKRISMTSSVGCGSFTANGTTGGGRGFCWRGFFFSAGKGKIHLVSKEEQCGMKKEMKVADGSTTLVMMSSWTFFGTPPLALWLLGDLSSDVAIAANHLRIRRMMSGLPTIGHVFTMLLGLGSSGFPKFHSNE